MLLFIPQSGEIQLFNLATSSLLESVQAHDEGKAVWSLCLQPDKVRLYVCHADCITGLTSVCIPSLLTCCLSAKQCLHLLM